MRHVSPLRYPGGKASLARFVTDVIDLNDLRGCRYYEPFAGGAGVALALLRDDVVSEVHVNDADVRIQAFWRASLDETERFARRIASVPLGMDDWWRQQAIFGEPSGHELFDVGFAAFYMNRCNRSGVLTGAGPIGGYQQAGKWRLDVRFNRETLAERILKLGRWRDRIHATGMDAIRFLTSELPRGEARQNVLVYLDPPYVKKGQRLYLNAFEARDHAALSRYMLRQRVLPWIMSYDDSDLVRQLYSGCRQGLLPINYTLQDKRTARELIIAPGGIGLPSVCRRGRGERPLQMIA